VRGIASGEAAAGSWVVVRCRPGLLGAVGECPSSLLPSWVERLNQDMLVKRLGRATGLYSLGEDGTG